MRVRDRGHDRETEAGAALRARARRLAAVEALEDALGLLVGESRTLVCHLDHGAPVVARDSHLRRGRGRRVRAHVCEQVVDHLAQALGVALDDDRLRRLELEEPVRLQHPCDVDGLARDLRQVDLRPLERTALIEAGEQEQVVDEHAHPLGLALDPGHRAREVLRPVARASLEELGVRLHRGKGRPQLVGRVAHEPAKAVLGGRPLGECPLDLPEHGVQRDAQPPDLRALVGILDPATEVAGCDRLRGVLDPDERPQAQADEPEPEADDRGDDPERHQQLDQEQVVERRVDLVQRRGHDELRAVGEDLEVRAVVDRPVRPDRDVLLLVRSGRAALRETRLRQSRLPSKRLGWPPEHATVGGDAAYVDPGSGLRELLQRPGGEAPARELRLDAVRDSGSRVVDAAREERALRGVGGDVRGEEPDDGEGGEHEQQPRAK